MWSGCNTDGPGSAESCRSSSINYSYSYTYSYSYNGSGSNRPFWLQASLAELEEKMKALSVNLHEEDDSNSFANRAENYYRKRPQLLNLLQHLYNNYLSLADRYCRQSLTKSFPHSSQILAIPYDIDDDPSYPNPSDSDAESSLSYQIPQQCDPTPLDPDVLVAQLVIKTVDYEFTVNELSVIERRSTESSRKMELQKSLLEVLESERLILLNENSRLGYQMTTLMEENKGLVSESAMAKRKASELARCVLKMREDHRVCVLSRKIEDLQGQISGLEKKNKEYHEQLVRKEEQEREKSKKREMVALEVCFEVEKLKSENKSLKEEAEMMKRKSRSSKWWWDRVKKFDLFFLCGPSYNPKFS